jgi:hypothetical protein
VSAGNVSKVKQLLRDAIPELHDALRLGEIRISRAAAWAKTSPTVQRHRLNDHRNGRGIHRTIRRLLKKHEPDIPRFVTGFAT